MERKFLVRAGLSRNYGKHEIYYELSEEITAHSTGEIKDAFLSLQSLLENQIAVYEAVSLPHVQLPQGSQPESVGTRNDDSFLLESILIESQGGKRRVKAVGGKYVKHGVPVYPECGTDLPLDSLDYGPHNFRHLNLTVKVELEDGKPRRAVSIR